MSGYSGDIALGATIDIQFTTRAFATGIPTTLGGTPVVSAYIDNGLTQLTAGITLGVDHDGVTGLNNVRVVASSGNGYATATNVSLVITTGTVGGVSVVGEQAGSFSIENRSFLRPTTAGRTLNVSATGEADSNIVQLLGNAIATPTVNGVMEVDVTHWLGTAVATPTVAGVPEVDMTHISGDAQSATDLKDFADAGYDPATNKLQGLVLADTVTTYTSNTPQTGDSFARIGVNGAGLTAIDLPDQTMNITGNITGNLSGSVGSVTGAVGSVTGNVGGNVLGGVAGNLGGSVLGNVDGTIGGLTVSAVADFFTVDSGETYASSVAGSVVQEIADNAGGGSDPWATSLPGAYAPGEAGYILGGMDDQFAAVNANINGLQEATVIKNVAKPNFPFCMKLSSDHYSPGIGKTITEYRSIDDGAFVSVDGTFEEVGNGNYRFNALADDTNGDELIWRFTAPDCDDTVVYVTTSTD